MKWTSENEQLLLKLMFETQTMEIYLETLANAWPGDEKPTPKALKEHLSKYRSKGKGAITFIMPAKAAGSSTTSTPRKKRIPKKVAVLDEAEANEIQGDELAYPGTPTKRSASGAATTPRKKIIYESPKVEHDNDEA